MILRNQSTIMIISFQIIDNSTVCSTARNYCPFVRAIRWRPAGSPSQGDNNTEIASMSKRFYDMTASIFLDPLLYPVGYLTYRSRVTNICVSKLGYHWF